MDNAHLVILLGGAAARRHQQQIFAAVYAREQEEQAAWQQAHSAATHVRNAAFLHLVSDHHVGLLDAETAEALCGNPNMQRVRNTPTSREHVTESRRPESDFAFGQMIGEMTYALVNVVLFESCADGFVNAIAKRPGTRESFFILRLWPDESRSEWVLKSFNRTRRNDAIAEHDKVTDTYVRRWSFTPAALRAYVRCESPFG